MIKLTFTTLPMSTNRLYRRGRGKSFYMDGGAKQNKESIAWEARAQYRGRPLEGRIRARIGFWWPNKRRHDIDNIKSFLDALTGILWVDDSQIYELALAKGIDKKNPRVVLEAEEID